MLSIFPADPEPPPRSLSGAAFTPAGGVGGGPGGGFIAIIWFMLPLMAPMELMLSSPCKNSSILPRCALKAQAHHDRETLTDH